MRLDAEKPGDESWVWFAKTLEETHPHPRNSQTLVLKGTLEIFQFNRPILQVRKLRPRSVQRFAQTQTVSLSTPIIIISGFVWNLKGKKPSIDVAW